MVDELSQKLRGLLPKLEYARETHRQWRDCDQSYRDANPDIGSPAFHQQAVDDYDERIRLVKEAADRLESAERAIREGTHIIDGMFEHMEMSSGVRADLCTLRSRLQKALANTGEGGGGCMYPNKCRWPECSCDGAVDEQQGDGEHET